MGGGASPSTRPARTSYAPMAPDGTVAASWLGNSCPVDSNAVSAVLEVRPVCLSSMGSSRHSSWACTATKLVCPLTPCCAWLHIGSGCGHTARDGWSSTTDRHSQKLQHTARDWLSFFLASMSSNSLPRLRRSLAAWTEDSACLSSSSISTLFSQPQKSHASESSHTVMRSCTCFRIVSKTLCLHLTLPGT